MEGVVSGDLEQFGLDSLIQTLDISGKPSRIRLSELSAEIVLARGRLNCSWRTFRGAAALSRILLLGRGPFVVDFEVASLVFPNPDFVEVLAALATR